MQGIVDVEEGNGQLEHELVEVACAPLTASLHGGDPAARGFAIQELLPSIAPRACQLQPNTTHVSSYGSAGLQRELHAAGSVPDCGIDHPHSDGIGNCALEFSKVIQLLTKRHVARAVGVPETVRQCRAIRQR